MLHGWCWVSKHLRIPCPLQGLQICVQDYRGMGRAYGTEEIFIHSHSLLQNIIKTCLRSDSSFPYTEEDGLILFAESRAHCCCYCCINYIMQEAHKDFVWEIHKQWYDFFIARMRTSTRTTKHRLDLCRHTLLVGWIYSKKILLFYAEGTWVRHASDDFISYWMCDCLEFHFLCWLWTFV